MKRILIKFTALLVAVITVFSFFACKDESNNEESGNAGFYDPNHGVDLTSQKLVIVSDKMSEYKIVYPSDGTECEYFAATELKDFIKQATGVVLPVVKDGTVGYSSRSKYISVGDTKLWDAADFELNDAELKLDGFVLKTEGNMIFIRGARDKGTLFGVYDFLEKFVGVRFFSPDETYVPTKDVLEIHQMDVKEIPAINIRNYYSREVDMDELYTNRLRMYSLYGLTSPKYGGGLYDIGYIHAHNTLSYIDFNTYKDYPNFFYKGQNDYMWDICFSYGLTADGEIDKSIEISPFSVVLENLKKTIEENPDFVYFSVCQQDIPFGCGCATCKSRDTVAQGGRSGILLRFINALSNALEPWLAEKYPEGREIKLVTFAYSYAESPPLNLEGEWAVIPNDNVCIWLATCPNLAYSLSDERQSTQTKSLVSNWSKGAKTFFWWDYRTNFREYLFYMPGLTTLQGDIEKLVEIGTEYAFLEAASGTPSDPITWQGTLKAYVASKLLWNPNRNVKELVEEYCNYYYGSSSQTVLKVIELFEDNYERLRQDESLSSSFGIHLEFGYNTLTGVWYPRSLLLRTQGLIKAEIERVLADGTMNEADKQKRFERLTNVLCTPQRMLLRNYARYYENDAAGENALAEEFLENCRIAGMTQDLGGYGFTYQSLKDSYGL